MKQPPAGSVKQSIRDELMLHVELCARDAQRDDSHFSVLTFPGIEGVSNPRSFENQMLSKYLDATVLGLEHDRTTWIEAAECMDEHQGRMSLLRMPADQYFQRAASYFDVMFLDYCGAASKKAVDTWKLVLDSGYLNYGAILAITICTSARAAGVNKRNLGGNTANHLRDKIQQLVRASAYYRASRLLFLREYANREVSRRAQSMMVAAFTVF